MPGVQERGEKEVKEKMVEIIVKVPEETYKQLREGARIKCYLVYEDEKGHTKTKREERKE